MIRRIIGLTIIAIFASLILFGTASHILAKYGKNSPRLENLGNNISNEGIVEQLNGLPVQHRENLEIEVDQELEGNADETLNSTETNHNDLRPEESAALIFMREEEKLAYDVYVTLFALWNIPTFQNINQSELTHINEIKILLDRYKIKDPASNEIGVFTNPDLQALYNELISRGKNSLTEAIIVGAEIEEIDIIDLQSKLSLSNNKDILQVFSNLLDASYIHLRALTSAWMNQTGEAYTPKYLDSSEFQTIVASNQGGHGKRIGGRSGFGNQAGLRP
jgi:hypothetical protein